MARQKLSFFPWYAAESTADEDWIAMSMAERGLFITLLEYGWINEGLPVELSALARIARVSDDAFACLWDRVSKKFVRRGERYFNQRQEIERERAKSKSRKAKESAESRWNSEKEVDANALRTQCYISHSTYNSSQVEDLPKTPEGSMRETKLAVVRREDEFADWAEKVYILHPKQANKFQSLTQLASYFAKDPTAKDIFERNYPQWIEYWKNDDPKYVPPLANREGGGFVGDETWRKPPPKLKPNRSDRKEVARQEFLQRLERDHLNGKG